MDSVSEITSVLEIAIESQGLATKMLHTAAEASWNYLLFTVQCYA